MIRHCVALARSRRDSLGGSALLTADIRVVDYQQSH
jgi:hypothetical protein